MVRTRSSDEDNGSFAAIRPDLHDAESGFESADVRTEATDEDGYRRESGVVPEPAHRSLAERLRETAKG